MNNEKYLGESALKDKPKKKLNFIIRDGSITTSKLSPSSVTTEKIKDGAVTEEKIKDEAVTNRKLESSSVDSRVIKDDAVVTSKIKDGNVVESKIADGNVTTPKIKDGAVTWQKLSKEIRDAIENGLGVNLTTVTRKSFSNKILARNEVPVEYRTKGLIITYILDGSWLTEQYQGLGSSTDDWQDDNLWRPISGIESSFPIKTRNVYDEFMRKTQDEINNELASHVTMSDLSLDLKFDEETGDIYGITSPTSIFEEAEQEDNGDVVITIK